MAGSCQSVTRILWALLAMAGAVRSADDPDTGAVTIDWQFSATPDEVWRAWTDPDLVGQWFGSDPAGKVTRATLDLRPGGEYSVTFEDRTGLEHRASGVYRDVDRPRALSFTWTWQSEPDHETQVRVVLTPRDGGTAMRFEHAQLWSGSSHGYEEGWRRTFAKMQRAIDAARR
jgi:uncharacterized protein YndB with AHSA1/START domain